MSFETILTDAIPDPRLQERACPCVILKPGEQLTFQELQRFLADKGVARHYWPGRLEVLAEPPKTPSGKILKFQLRDRVKVGGG